MPELFRYLDLAGDGTGRSNFNEDYSARPAEALIERNPRNRVEIHRMVVTVVGPAGFRADSYGPGSTPLANGITLAVEDRQGGTTLDITDNVPITTNFEWGGLCYDASIKTWGFSEVELLLVRFTFTRSLGEPLTLDSGRKYRFAVRLNDNFENLIAHRFHVQGWIRGADGD